MNLTFKNFNEMPDIALLRIKQILQLLPIGRTTFFNKVRTGEYPAGRKISKRVRAWTASEVRVLLNKLQQSKDKGGRDESK